MRIGILDDTPEDARILQEYLSMFKKNIEEALQVNVYQTSMDFLEEFKNQYDVLFLDIEMVGDDGLQVAREVRKTDSSVAIIFVTNMAQYAIEGYKVNAIDFMVKPVGYYLFCETLKKAINFKKRRNTVDILVNDTTGIYKINSDEITYVEKYQDKVIYHTINGDYIQRSTIKAVKEKLEQVAFGECSSGLLVNLSAVKYVGKEEIKVAGATLPLSRRQKKTFTEEYIKFVGGAMS